MLSSVSWVGPMRVVESLSCTETGARGGGFFRLAILPALKLRWRRPSSSPEWRCVVSSSGSSPGAVVSKTTWACRPLMTMSTVSWMPLSSRSTAAMLGGLSAGSLASKRSSRRSREEGMPSSRRDKGSGCSVQCSQRYSWGRRARKGGAPLRSSYRRIPMPYWSARWSTCPPVICSGDMYEYEPTTWPS